MTGGTSKRMIKASKNPEFDVIYDDGTRKRVKEGVLHEVENEEIIFHNATNRPEVWIAAAEDMLKALNMVPGGIESLMTGMASDDGCEKALTRMRRMLKSIRELEKEDSAEKQAIFRLGQMDMKESILVLQQDKPKADSTLFNMRKSDLIEYVRTLEHNYNVGATFLENQAKYIEFLDMVEVVRCKDCKHYVWDEFDGCYACVALGRFVKPDFWCAYGERRTDGR